MVVLKQASGMEAQPVSLINIYIYINLNILLIYIYFLIILKFIKRMTMI